MAYSSLSFNPFDQLNASDMNQAFENTDLLKSGEAIDDNAILERHLQGRAATFALTGYGKSARTGDGVVTFEVPFFMNNMNLVDVELKCETPGTGSLMLVQIHNLTDGQDMLSTRISIDSTESNSDNAAAPYVIDTGFDDVATGDIIRIDVDQVHTTPAKTVHISLKFELP